MNKIIILFILAILPVVTILFYVYHHDKNKEPITLLTKLFILGIISGSAVIMFSKFILIFFPYIKNINDFNLWGIFLYSFLAVALVEELFKWLIVYFNGYHSLEFDELYDSIVYATFVSLGFAFFENVLYIFSYNTLAIAIVRALSAVPSHACDAIFMGYFLSIAKAYHYQNNKKQEKKYLLLSLIVPIIIHGIYDFCLLSNLKIYLILFFIFVGYIYIISIKKLKEVAFKNKLYNQNNIEK